MSALSDDAHQLLSIMAGSQGAATASVYAQMLYDTVDGDTVSGPLDELITRGFAERLTHAKGQIGSDIPLFWVTADGCAHVGRAFIRDPALGRSA